MPSERLAKKFKKFFGNTSIGKKFLWRAMSFGRQFPPCVKTVLNTEQGKFYRNAVIVIIVYGLLISFVLDALFGSIPSFKFTIQKSAAYGLIYYLIKTEFKK